MEQSSAEWLEWRLKGLGGSDAPVVMGVSPYTTRYQLWLEKTGQAERDQEKDSLITDRGHQLEAYCRPQYELYYGYDVPPCTMEHETIPWLRASLDGFNAQHRVVVENKWVGKRSYEEVKYTHQPLPHHVHQLQHQLMVSNADKAHYVVYNDDYGKIFVVEVLPDAKIQEDYMREATAFWELVQKKIPPELCDKDELPAEGELAELFMQFRIARETQNTDMARQLKDHIVSQMPHTRMRAHGVLISKTKAGNYQARVS